MRERKIQFLERRQHCGINSLRMPLLDISLETLVDLADTLPDDCDRPKFEQMISLLCPGTDHSDLKAYLEDTKEGLIKACSNADYESFNFR